MGNILYPMWAECPAMTRLLIASMPAMSLATMLLGPMMGQTLDTLFNNSFDRLMQLHVWSLVASMFFEQMLSSGMGFIGGLFAMYMVMMYLPHKEKEIGSTTMLIWLCVVNALIGVAHAVMMFPLGMYQMEYRMTPTIGMWPLVLTVLTLRMLADPDGSCSFFGLFVVPAKYYPLCLAGFWCLLSFGIQWPLVAALAVGYAIPRFRLERFLPSPLLGGKIEQRLSCCRAGRGSILGAAWVPANSVANYSRYSSDMDDFRRTSGQSLNGSAGRAAGGGGGSGGGGGGGAASGSGGSSAFVAFSGSGQTLGDGGGDSILPQSAAASPPGAAAAPMAAAPLPTIGMQDSGRVGGPTAVAMAEMPMGDVGGTAAATSAADPPRAGQNPGPAEP